MADNNGTIGGDFLPVHDDDESDYAGNDEQQRLLNGPLAGIMPIFSSSESEDQSHQENLTARERLSRYLNAQISLESTEIPLICCFLLSGMIDSGAYNAYQCFTHMMTGNTVFAALGVADLPADWPKYAWTKSVCSIGSFVLGTIVFSLYHWWFKRPTRAALCLSFLIQTALVIASAALVLRGDTSEVKAKVSMIATLPQDPGFPWLEMVPIGLLSFQAAGKVRASRLLQASYLPTNVLSTIYSDFFATFFQCSSQNLRRAAAVNFYVIGAMLGAAFVKSSWVKFSGTLWVAAAVNLFIAFWWLAFEDDRIEEDRNEQERLV